MTSHTMKSLILIQVNDWSEEEKKELIQLAVSEYLRRRRKENLTPSGM